MRSTQKRQGRTARATWTSLALVLVLLASCGGAGGEEPDGEAANEGVDAPDDEGADAVESEWDETAELVFYDSAPNHSMDPHDTVNDNNNAQAAPIAVYDRLIDLDSGGQIVPGLAEEWGFTNEELTEFELVLREGVTFHDGEPLDAEAVVANLERMIELSETGEAGANVAAAAGRWASVEAVDDMLVRITLVDPHSSLPFDLAVQPGMMISPASIAAEREGAELEPVGAGPYKLVSLTPGSVVEMERFDDYWGGAEGRPATFEVHYVPEADTRLNAVRSGAADVALIEARQVEEAEAADLEVTRKELVGIWFTMLNADGPLGDPAVRQAMMHAIDREAIVENVMFGEADVTEQLFSPNYPFYNEDMAGTREYDPERARELLAEAGYEDGVTLTHLLLNTPEYHRLSEAFSEMYAAVGITLEHTVGDVSRFADFGAGEFDLLTSRWGGRPDPLNNLGVTVTSSGKAYVPGGAVDPRLDALYEEGLGVEFGDPRYTEIILEMGAIATEQAALLPIATRVNLYAYQPGCLEGPGEYPAQGSEDWRQARVPSSCS